MVPRGESNFGAGLRSSSTVQRLWVKKKTIQFHLKQRIYWFMAADPEHCQQGINISWSFLPKWLQFLLCPAMDILQNTAKDRTLNPNIRLRVQQSWIWKLIGVCLVYCFVVHWFNLKPSNHTIKCMVAPAATGFHFKMYVFEAWWCSTKRFHIQFSHTGTCTLGWLKTQKGPVQSVFLQGQFPACHVTLLVNRKEKNELI